MKNNTAWPLLALAGALLSGCSTSPAPRIPAEDPEFAYRQRSERLEAVTGWEFFGRLSMDDGADGGSGRLHWRAGETGSQLDFRGALGRGAWRLRIGPDAAILEREDGSRASAATAGQLIRQEIGWNLPVVSLEWWVLGMAAPGDMQSIDLDGDGLVRRLEQDGWIIDFERYLDVDGLRMPRRMEAVSGRYRVKLAVSRWVLNDGASRGG